MYYRNLLFFLLALLIQLAALFLVFQTQTYANVSNQEDCNNVNYVNECIDDPLCFWYKGKSGERPHCAPKYNGVGGKCPDTKLNQIPTACYADQSCPGDYCVQNPTSSNESCKSHSDCPADQFCISNVIGQKGSSSCVSKGVGGPNSICEDYAAQGLQVDIVCASQSCNRSTLRCTDPASSISCRSHSDCPANQFCISNVVGSKTSSSCVGVRVGGANAICEDFTSLGLPVNAVCTSQKCNTSSLRCEAPLASGESCKSHTDCGTNEFCISNVIGSRGSSSCVPKSVGGTNSICEDYTAQGLPVNAVCSSQKCNTSTLRCDAAAGTTNPGPSGGGSGTCETEDNRPLNASLADKTFHCKAGCDAGTEEDKTGQGALYACTGTLRCCKDKAKYSQYYGSSIGGNSTSPAPGGGSTSPGGGTTSPGGGTNTPSGPNCSSIKLANPDGSSIPAGIQQCTTTSGCYMNIGDYTALPYCDSSANKGTACGSSGFCSTNQVCQPINGSIYCTNKGSVQPGNGYNTCATTDTPPKPNDTVCSSGKCDPTTLKCTAVTPTTPPAGSSTSPIELCKNHGGSYTYINSACDHILYNDAVAASKLCTLHNYFDRITCTDGTTYDIPVPASNAVCTSGAWCPSSGSGGSPTPPAGTTCTRNCSSQPGTECSFDYNDPTYTHMSCTQPGYRYCPTASSPVPASQGCADPNRVGIGQTCTTDANCNDAPAGAKCLDFGSSGKTCQWPGGIGPSATPGAPTTSDCLTQIANNQGRAGCACPIGGGCGVGMSCYQSADLLSTPDNPNSQFCTPTGTRWCNRTQSSTSTPLTCAASAPYSPTPSPTNILWQSDCPATGSNQCVPGTCENASMVQHPATGPGGTNGNRACSYSATGDPNATGYSCCIPATSSGGSGGGTGGTGGTTGGTSSTCKNDLSEQCQAGSDGLQANTCISTYHNVGKRDCGGNTTCCAVN